MTPIPMKMHNQTVLLHPRNTETYLAGVGNSEVVWFNGNPPANACKPLRWWSEGTTDDIRELLMYVRGVRAVPLIVIIVDADRLKYRSAPALLKILEEPPAKVNFVLVAEEFDMVLPTIRSRAVQTADDFDSQTSFRAREQLAAFAWRQYTIQRLNAYLAAGLRLPTPLTDDY